MHPSTISTLLLLPFFVPFTTSLPIPRNLARDPPANPFAGDGSEILRHVPRPDIKTENFQRMRKKIPINNEDLESIDIPVYQEPLEEPPAPGTQDPVLSGSYYEPAPTMEPWIEPTGEQDWNAGGGESWGVDGGQGGDNGESGGDGGGGGSGGGNEWNDGNGDNGGTGESGYIAPEAYNPPLPPITSPDGTPV